MGAKPRGARSSSNCAPMSTGHLLPSEVPTSILGTTLGAVENTVLPIVRTPKCGLHHGKSWAAVHGLPDMCLILDEHSAH
jgi:hypothetical protein